MILEPWNNKELIGYNNFFLYLKVLFDNKKLPNKIIFSGNKGIGKSTLAYHLTNYIFSLDENNKYDFKQNLINNDNSSFKYIINNSHPNFFLISNNLENSNSQISKVRELINFTNKSSFNNSFKIIIIDNVELMNASSVNALLKLVEEPNEKILFFLIHNNNKNIINTLQSRCIKFKMFIDKTIKEEIINKYLDSEFYNNLNYDFKYDYITPGDIFSLHLFFKENDINEKISIEDLLKLVLENKYFKKDLFVKNNLNFFVELFFIKKFNYYNSKDKIYNLYKYFISKLNNTQKYNLDMESVLIELNRKFVNG